MSDIQRHHSADCGLDGDHTGYCADAGGNTLRSWADKRQDGRLANEPERLEGSDSNPVAPRHYGVGQQHEMRKCIAAWNEGMSVDAQTWAWVWDAIVYLGRLSKKPESTVQDDLGKALFWIGCALVREGGDPTEVVARLKDEVLS